MITGRTKEPLTSESVFQKIDDYNIYRHYLGTDINLKKHYPSPFRSSGIDKNPNLHFFIGKTGKLLYKDFANGYSGDSIDFVMRLHNCNYNEALMRINQDFYLGLGIGNNNSKNNSFTKIQIYQTPESFKVKKVNLLQVVPKPFTKKDMKYWESYSISKEELEAKKVYSVQKLYINKQLVPNYEKTIRFAYLFDDYIKVYSPLSKEMKWISSTPNDYISGFDEIKHKVYTRTQDKKLIITKSVKDEIILGKFFKDVCSTQNESKDSINQENLNYILKGYSPENTYIAYDNDRAGVESSTYYTATYGFNYMNVPQIYRYEGITDWADLSREKGLETVGNYLKIKGLL